MTEDQMNDKEQAYLGLIDRHLADLEERIQEIKARITVMKDQGCRTHHQTELLANMLKVLKSMQTIRLGTLNKLGAEDKQAQGNPRTD
jgi:hypothetical protein